MPIWTNEYLDSLTLEAEIAIAGEIPCIIDRISLEVFGGISQYTLPEYVNNIRRVFYKGYRLDPVAHVGFDLYDEMAEDGAFVAHAFSDGYFIDGNITETGSNVGGKPWRYFYSTFGENVIRFDPGIPEDIPSFLDGLYDINIDKAVIIEFYRVPNGIDFKIPEYICRRTIKAYVLWKSFLKEGDGQNIQAAEYWKAKYAIAIARAKIIINGIYSAAIISRTPNNLAIECEGDYGYQGPYEVARPILPSNYGIEVGDDYCE